MEEPTGTSAESPANSGDALPSSSGHTVATVETEEYMVSVLKCSEPMIGNSIYRMESNPRGFCLIFNCFQFTDPEYSPRLGSEVEAKRLYDIFTQLHFSVKVFDNLIDKEINLKVEEYSQNGDLVKHDAIVVIVLSHGKSDGFAASDGKVVSYIDIIDKLNNKNCPNLVNKPKIFWFSCCRGDNKDYGVEHTIQALNDIHLSDVCDSISVPQPDGTPIQLLVPMISDILICYSTIDKHVAWRCTHKGTWLGMALSQVLAKHSHDTDLLQIVTKMSHLIDEKEFYDGFKPSKQVVEVILRGFKKTFYFNPGYYLKDSATGDNNNN